MILVIPSPGLLSARFIIYLIYNYFFPMNWLRNKRRISGQDLREMLKRIDRAYGIVELNERESMIIERNRMESLFEIRSSKDKDKFYRVDTNIQMCTCPDFNFRLLKCKHIIAAEFASGVTS